MAFEATLHRRNDKAHQGSAGRRRSSCTLAKTDIERMARWSEIWLRGRDLNPRPSGYEPDELPGCSTPHFQNSFDVDPAQIEKRVFIRKPGRKRQSCLRSPSL